MRTIENVYEQNCQQAFQNISQIIKRYKFIAIDTEFPGFFTDMNLLSQKLGRQMAQGSPYDALRQNVDGLKLVQFGIAFSDGQGNYPTPAAYQFNMKFDINEDLCAGNSRAFLQQSFTAIELERMRTEGIYAPNFSAGLASSGLLFNPNLRWFCFHGNQDFCYFLKAITMDPLPSSSEQCKQLIGALFPHHCDLKTATKWEFSLGNLALQRGIDREDKLEHQAGSDAFLTLRVAEAIGPCQGDIHDL